MSDQGEKTCPLCAEEMDLTDQQLKPCKCGYQICVWCWHHIMDMAEKDDSEGRCPACRTPYDKEKIVAMTANCERLVSDVNVERKKSQKSKMKPSEGRKQLSSVRVIQRNLVYIVGLPLNLADEDLLQRKEYFGQYGKVLKVSMSRTAAGVIQQFPNNTCSVYITYAREEEAIRCIQSVHGFVLDGRSLKACFGTTKYCHAWLRNVPCSNPDCLYLHEIGSQEDSFTKDEIISAYTRSRVQQITGVTNNLQRRSGNMLPPPIDDYCTNSSTAKPIIKIVSSNTTSIPKSSPPNGSSARSVALPAAASWGMRASNQQSVQNIQSLNGSSYKQRPGVVNGMLAFSSAVTNTTPVPLSQSDVLKKPSLEEGHTMHNKSIPDLPKQDILVNSQRMVSKRPASPDRDPTRNQISCSLASTYSGKVTSLPSGITNAFDHSQQSYGDLHLKGHTEEEESIDNLCADVSSLSLNTSLDGHFGGMSPRDALSDLDINRSAGNERLPQQYAEQSGDLSLKTDVRDVTSPNGVCTSRADRDWRTEVQSQVGMNSKPNLDEDILSFDSQHLKDPEVVSHLTHLPNSANSIHMPNGMSFNSSQHSENLDVVNSSSDSFLDNRGTDRLLLSNGLGEKPIVSAVGSRVPVEHFSLFANERNRESQTGNLGGDSVGTGEDHIISNILSLDFDPWDESLTSPQDLAKLLGSETNPETSSLALSNPRKVQQNNQSRFSFARQEESSNQALEVEPCGLYGHDSIASKDPYLDKFGIRNGLASSYSAGLESFATNPSVFSANKRSVSRPQISAPPGFSVPSRSPPPGFSSNERMDHTFDATSGSHMLDPTSLLRSSYQAPPPSANIGSAADIEFMDPAILAVGRGRFQDGLPRLDNSGLEMRSNFSPQLNSFENEARLQLLMQRSLSGQQSLRFPDIGDHNISYLNESYGFSSRLMDHSQGTSLSAFTQLSRQQSPNSLMSNGHWDRWNEAQVGSNLGMAELLRNERLGFSSNNYTAYEEPKFRMPNIGDLYNRTYRM